MVRANCQFNRIYSHLGDRLPGMTTRDYLDHINWRGKTHLNCKWNHWGDPGLYEWRGGTNRIVAVIHCSLLLDCGSSVSSCFEILQPWLPRHGRTVPMSYKPDPPPHTHTLNCSWQGILPQQWRKKKNKQTGPSCWKSVSSRIKRIRILSPKPRPWEARLLLWPLGKSG